ncbi:hypothetical protein J7J90_00390 [Candidatus Micrarchaeota archaeon]|nr:hypothetical protein [Candidatus Micrarchaeota archaeon]
MPSYEIKKEMSDEEKLLQEHLLEKYKGKMVKKLPEGFAETLEELPWESILELAEDYKKRMKERTSEIKDLQQKLAFALLIIEEHLRQHKAGRIGFDIKFVKSLLRLMSKSYKLSIQYEVDLDEFMLLLTIIIEKMKKEKVSPYSKQRTNEPTKFEKIDTQIDMSNPDDNNPDDNDENDKE